MQKVVFFCQLAVLLAVSCGQLHDPTRGSPVESNDLLRRREDFLRQQHVTGASRPNPSPQRSQDMRHLTQIRDELQRSEELIRMEMLRLRQLQLQQAALNQQLRPIPQPQTHRENIPQPQQVVPQVHRENIPQPLQVAVPQVPRESLQQAPQVAVPQALRPQAPQVGVPQVPREFQRVAPPHRLQVGQPTRQREHVDDEDETLFRKQAENAHYTFNSAVNDGIYDSSQLREETRDGLNVQGLYAYSDGFFKRIVHYVADENGYRVVNETAEPIGEGPLINARGSAEVSSVISGVGSQYQITAADIPGFNLPPHKQERS